MEQQGAQGPARVLRGRPAVGRQRPPGTAIGRGQRAQGLRGRPPARRRARSTIRVRGSSGRPRRSPDSTTPAGAVLGASAATASPAATAAPTAAHRRRRTPPARAGRPRRGRASADIRTLQGPARPARSSGSPRSRAQAKVRRGEPAEPLLRQDRAALRLRRIAGPRSRTITASKPARRDRRSRARSRDGTIVTSVTTPTPSRPSRASRAADPVRRRGR